MLRAKNLTRTNRCLPRMDPCFVILLRRLKVKRQVEARFERVGMMWAKNTLPDLKDGPVLLNRLNKLALNT